MSEEITGRKEEAEMLMRYATETLGLNAPQAVTALVRAAAILLDRIPDPQRELAAQVCMMPLQRRGFFGVN